MARGANAAHGGASRVAFIAALLLIGAGLAEGHTKDWCLPHRYQPSNVTVAKGVPNSGAKDFPSTKPKFLVNDKEFEVVGVGYSPIPPGLHTLDEVFDYFTEDRDFIWKRDVPIISGMGANVIRTWSWDATQDHTPFLDYCDNHGLKVLVPFLVTSNEYPKLSDPTTIHQMLMDWKAFVNKIKNHPALFGYMIGNELNQEFAGQYEDLFSIVNSMVVIRDDVDPMGHPITMPFSDAQFIDELVVKYYAWLNIDFWSLQIYRDDTNIRKVSEDYTRLFKVVSQNPPPETPAGPNDGMFQHLPVKPLVFTEYGLDALVETQCSSWNTTCTMKDLEMISSTTTGIPENETKQALGFCKRFNAIHKGVQEVADQDSIVYVSGGVVMEYCDEWWKGSFPDVRRAGCPNQRTDLHTYCSQNINKYNNGTAYFLHEEWLGLFSQNPAVASDEKMLQDMSYCIEPRLSFCVMKTMFGKPDTSCEAAHAACLAETSWKGEQCGSKKEFSNNVIIIWGVAPIVILAAVCLMLSYNVGRSWTDLFKTALYSMAFFLDSGKHAVDDDDVMNPHTADTHHGTEPKPSTDQLDDEREGDERDALLSPALIPSSGKSNGSHTPASKARMHSRGSLLPCDIELMDECLARLELDVSGAFWSYSATPTEKHIFDEVGLGSGGTLLHFLTDVLPKHKRCPYFKVSQERLLHMIHNQFKMYCFDGRRMSAAEVDGSMSDAIRIVYEKYTEGYYLYLGKDTVAPVEGLNSSMVMIRLLALYMIIQQWSGTINHSPEKICELLDWAENYFAAGEPAESVVPPAGADEVWKRRVLRISGFHHGTIEIARSYCMKVHQEQYSFDDVNEDSLYRIKKILQKSTTKEIRRTESEKHQIESSQDYDDYASKAFVMGTEGDLLPLKAPHIKRRDVIHGTHLEYNRAARQEDCVMSDYGRGFFGGRLPEQRTGGEVRFFPPEIAFPQRGGAASLVVNYQWLIRYLLWQNLIAAYLQPVGRPECAQWFLLNRLALFDSVLCFLCTFFHYIILRRLKRRLIVELAFYFISMLMVLFTALGHPYIKVICQYFDGECDNNVGPVVHIEAGVTLDVATTYLVLAFFYTACDEIRLMCRFSITQPHRLSGRFCDKNQDRQVMWVRVGYVVPLAIAGILAFVIALGHYLQFTLWDWWPNMDLYLLVVVLSCAPLLAGWGISKLIMRSAASTRTVVGAESFYMLANIVFWGAFFAMNWMLAYHILVPSVDNVGFEICGCTHGDLPLTEDQVVNCKGKIEMMCYVGVAFVWISAYLVSFVFLFAAYEILLLVFGVARGKYVRVGNVQDWHDAESYWSSILRNSLGSLSGAFNDGIVVPKGPRPPPEHTDKGVSTHQALAWNNFVDAMQRDHLLSEAEADALRVEGASTRCDDDRKKLVPNFGMKPRSDEAKRQIVTHLWGLESLSAHEGNRETQRVDVNGKRIPFTSEERKAHRVVCMPTCTTVVPCYNEDIQLSSAGLKMTRSKGATSKRISEIEYLALIFTAEWQNFAQAMGKSHPGQWSSESDEEDIGSDLLNAYLGHNHTSLPLRQVEDALLIKEVELWATHRGQTLARTIRGLCNQRLGIEQLCIIEEYNRLSPKEILEIVARKYQVLIAHQTYDPKKIGQQVKKGILQEHAMLETFQREKFFEVVINDDKVFQSHRLVLRKELLYPSLPPPSVSRAPSPEGGPVEVVQEKGEHELIQESAVKCAEVIEKIKREQDRLIKKQLDMYLDWHTDQTRTTPLPEGTMVRVVVRGQFVGRRKSDAKEGDVTHYDPRTSTIIGGKWLEGKVIGSKAVEYKSLPKKSLEASPSYTLRGKLAGVKDAGKSSPLVLEEVKTGSSKGLFIRRDRNKAFFKDNSMQGWTITRIEGSDLSVSSLKALVSQNVPLSLTFRKLPKWGHGDLPTYTVLLDAGSDHQLPEVPVETMEIGGETRYTVKLNADFVEPFPFNCLTIQRVSQLKIGEGKAENQIHALPFARGEVLQAIDMNQYATADQGMRVPFLLNDFFGVPDKRVMRNVQDASWNHSLLIPPYRIVGFPEHCYTRRLSMVGELMGAAEWCFVTINQRVLNWPLRIRMHYGHPDFFDGYWARTRGGTSKASPIVNTNEDIFAGYEMLARGERGSYVEFMEVQKGRESAFPNAYVFESKLAQGAAQQVRSYDVYVLNRKLDMFQRFALFYGSLAFYMTNFIMSISINYYILSIVMFSMSGVTYHQLGLMDAIIAIPWLLQIGYVLAIPMMVELIMQRGVLAGLGEFISTLPVAILFFIFHMRTKTFYFGRGLLLGAGGYASTGRGFGLGRTSMKEMYKMYSESHFKEAILIFICLVLYAVHGTDPVLPYLARTFTIILICVSWLWSPILFNPMTTTHDIHDGFKDMLDWVQTRVRTPSKAVTDAMERGLAAERCKRALLLEMNLTRETEERVAEQRKPDPLASLPPPEEGQHPAQKMHVRQARRESIAGDYSVAVPSHDEELQEHKAITDQKVVEWYSALSRIDIAPFTWKCPGGKKYAQIAIHGAEAKERQKEIVISFLEPLVSASFEAYQQALVSTLLGSEVPESMMEVFRFHHITDANLWLLHCKSDSDNAASMMEKYNANKEVSATGGLTLMKDRSNIIGVKLESFEVWSKRRVPTYDSLDQMMGQYWLTENSNNKQQQSVDLSWKAWFLKYVVLTPWMLEDDHAQSFIMRCVSVLIKLYLHAEFYMPWMLIAIAYFHMESLWLLLMCVFLLWLFTFINMNTRDRHDYPQSIKALTLLMLPLVVVYYHYSMITSKELLWSVIAFFIGACAATSMYAGAWNLGVTYWKPRKDNTEPHATPSSNGLYEAGKQQRRDDVERANGREKEKASVFLGRLRIPSYDVTLQTVVPFVAMALMATGEVLAAATSTWLTAMMYNGPVAEAWRRAYFQSSSAPPATAANEGPAGSPSIPEAQHLHYDSVDVSTGLRQNRMSGALRGSIAIPRPHAVGESHLQTTDESRLSFASATPSREAGTGEI